MSADVRLDAGASRPLDNRRGVVLTLLAFAVFSGTDAIVKLTAVRLPAPQITLLVTLAAFVVLCGYAAVTGHMRRLIPRQPAVAFLRALLLAGDTLLIHYAFALLPLSEAYLLAFLTPILVAVMSWPLLGERLSLTGWAGVLLGFVGVAVALKPGTAGLNLGHLAALGSAVLFALSLILLRRTKVEENDEALLSTLFVVLIPLALGVALAHDGLLPLRPFEAVLVVAGGILLLAGHGLLIRAFRIAEASLIAPFQYSQIIWGCLYGALLFSAPIEFHTLAGAAIIIVSGWLVLK
ncbi:EamA/RhaT family transporter [Rhizobium wuzhouense]|uniref:EamA/RhaT family transporter n=1 Tax=Rhizobium wuzhouense TaxID=1986026 RepID=A0ABX5NX16_9HYPH|nr:EamA/RhaT family transporter [Rhizobium wuzhouense]